MNSPIALDLALDVPETRYSLDEAVELIHTIHFQLESIEHYRLKLKWWMGFVLAHTQRPQNSKTEVVADVSERLWSDYGIRARKSLLYQCLKLYTGMSGDYRKYLDWIAMRRRAFNRPVYWYDVVDGLLGGKNNPEVIGREAADEQDYRDAERALEAIERIILRASQGNEEAAGVLEGLRQSVIGLMILSHSPVEAPRSEEYRRFVASHACVACGRPSDAHHALGLRGVGVKPSDFGCVPLCREHHIELHRFGPQRFEQFHGVSLLEAAFNLLHRFFTGSWITKRLEMRYSIAANGDGSTGSDVRTG